MHIIFLIAGVWWALGISTIAIITYHDGKLLFGDAIPMVALSLLGPIVASIGLIMLIEERLGPWYRNHKYDVVWERKTRGGKGDN